VMRSWVRGAGIVALAAAAFFSARYSVSDSQVQGPSAKHCAGRFDFVLPAALQPAGREQSLYLVKVWSEGKPAFPALRGAELRKFDLAGVGQAVWLQPSAAYPKDLKLLAMKPGQGHAVFLEAAATAGREQNAENVVARVAKGFVAGSTQGFCVEHGAFVLAPSKNERALASFKGAGVELSVQTETVGTPDDGQSTAGETPGVRTISKERRMVAGLNGIEEKVEVSEKPQARLVYTWIFAGEAGSGLRPRIHLKAGARQDQRAALDAAWTSLTGSLQPRAPGVR
jgi:hypothetical protein